MNWLYFSQVWSIVLPSALVGFLVGIIFCIIFFKTKGSTAKLHKKINDMECDFKDYQQKVNEHFTTSSKLISDFTEKYRDIHHHITSGASELCCSNKQLNDNFQNSLLSAGSIPDKDQNNIKDNIDKEDIKDNIPPKDYVSKNANNV